MYKYQKGKEITSWEQFDNLENKTIFLSTPGVTTVGVADLTPLKHDTFLKALLEGYHFYEREPVPYSPETLEFMQNFVELASEAGLTSEEYMNQDFLEKLYDKGWRIYHE